MLLRHIDKGTRLQIIVNPENAEIREEYEASFYDMHNIVSEKSFIVQCSKLYRHLDTLDQNADMEVSFSQGASVYTFFGAIIGKKQDMVILEQMGDVKTVNRRIYQRDELRVDVRVYKLREDMQNERKYSQPTEGPVLTELSFDISAGGMCIITNKFLKPEYHKFYLIEFNMGDKERFLLPAEIVRRSNYLRSAVGKFDYGFKFIFDNMPEEKSRLTKAILGKKLSSLRS